MRPEIESAVRAQDFQAAFSGRCGLQTLQGGGPELQGRARDGVRPVVAPGLLLAEHHPGLELVRRDARPVQLVDDCVAGCIGDDHEAGVVEPDLPKLVERLQLFVRQIRSGLAGTCGL